MSSMAIPSVKLSPQQIITSLELLNLVICFAPVNTNFLEEDEEDDDVVEDTDAEEEELDEEPEESDEDAIVEDELSEETLLPVLFLSPHAEKAPIIKMSDNVNAKILLIVISFTCLFIFISAILLSIIFIFRVPLRVKVSAIKPGFIYTVFNFCRVVILC